jgi:hypothetical protein
MVQRVIETVEVCSGPAAMAACSGSELTGVRTVRGVLQTSGSDAGRTVVRLAGAAACVRIRYSALRARISLAGAGVVEVDGSSCMSAPERVKS